MPDVPSENASTSVPILSEQHTAHDIIGLYDIRVAPGVVVTDGPDSKLVGTCHAVNHLIVRARALEYNDIAAADLSPRVGEHVEEVRTSQGRIHTGPTEEYLLKSFFVGYIPHLVVFVFLVTHGAITNVAWKLNLKRNEDN